MRISDWSSDVCSSDLQLAAEFPSQNNPANAANMGAVTTQTEQQRLLNETYKSSVSQREAAVAIMRLETSELYLNASATDQKALRESTLTAIRIKDTAAANEKIGRAHVRTPVNNAQLVIRLLLQH